MKFNKIIITTILISTFVFLLTSQANANSNAKIEKDETPQSQTMNERKRGTKTNVKKSSEKIVKSPDLPPLFKGGSVEMHRFIQRNLQYPEEAKEKGLDGLVTYTFIVEKDGSLTNLNRIHSADPLLNEEALRIIKSMPNWNPATLKGKPVRAESYVPLYFKSFKKVTGESANSKH